LERIQALQTTLRETLESFFETDAASKSRIVQEEPPAFELARDPALWKETISLIPSGRILGIAAQAESALATGSGAVGEGLWIADGRAYVRWIARGVSALSTGSRDITAIKSASLLLGKSVGIGYTDELVAALVGAMVFEKEQSETFYSVVATTTSWEQRQILTSLMSFLDHSSMTWAKSSSDQSTVSATSTLLHGLLTQIPLLQAELVEQLLTRSHEMILIRASILALDTHHLHSLLERSWAHFGDKLHIKHKPIAQQESNARLLLLVAGRVNRSDPKKIIVLARSSNHGNAISDRLGSSSPRVRWLGMVVGTAISGLVDKEGSKMDFDIDDMKTGEAMWYQGLVHVDDNRSTVDDMIKIARMRTTESRSSGKAQAATKSKTLLKSSAKPAKPSIIQIVDEDDLVPYAKPDSDPEDSEEDATLVNRKKPKTPVYIRDLVSGIDDGDDYERHLLALSTAASLIRKKADFGSELKDRAEELASSLIGLNDNFDIEDWSDMRQQALIALIVAQPRTMGPWFAKMFFVGDYSLSQRSSMLTAIGVGCRELAGFRQENTSLMKRQDEVNKNGFPSKQLPDRLHRVYADQTTPVDAIARQLEQTMLRPVATKVRPRTKMLKNDLATLVADCFFFPMTGHWQTFSQSTTHKRSPLNDPTIVAILTKTLTIILSAAGASSTALPQMISELWTLLLSLRSRALKHSPLLEAVLFGFLTILDVSEKRGMAERNGSVLLETREWVGLVWEKLESEGSVNLNGMVDLGIGEGDPESGKKDVERCRYLAAGVLVKIKEIVDEYQRLLAGDLANM